MNILVTNPMLLPMAALVLVPLILHLFARARPPVYPFSSVEFLRRVLRKSIRIKRPQSILVLVLRTILFASLIGMFLKPVFFAGQPLPGLGVRKEVVMVMDATASMAATDGSQSRFAAACAKGAEILSGLSSADTANIIWLGTPNRAEFPQLGANVAYLKKALRQATVTYEAADVNGGLGMAAAMLQKGNGVREIYILSDFQSTTWNGISFALPPGLQVYAIKIGEAQLPNIALTSVSSVPARPLVGQEAQVFCEVNNFSAEPALTTVYLRAGETHQSQEVRLGPWQKLPVLFQLKPASAGELAIAVSLSEDAFHYDNERWAVVEVVKELNIGVVETEPETARYWRRAVSALEWAKAATLLEADLEREIDVDALWLAGWTGGGAARDRLLDYLRRGGMVVWFSGTAANADSLRLLLPREISLSQTGAFWEKAEKPWHLRLADPANAVLAVYASGTYGDPARGTFAGRLRLPKFAGAAPVLDYEDGVPALTVIRQGGSLVLWNLPLQRAFSDWALHTEFVPFVGELILHHRRTTVSGSPHDFPIGQALARQFETEVLDKDVELWHGKQWVPVAPKPGGKGLWLTATEARTPGIYAWRYRDNPVEQQTVNFPSSESDLRTAPAPDLGNSRVVRIAGRQSIEQMREGQPLWPWLLALGMVVAGLEGLVLLRVDKP